MTRRGNVCAVARRAGLGVALFAAACGGGEPPEAGYADAGKEASAGRPLVVYAVNYPLAYFAERIGGDAVGVEFPAPADVDPAFWSPAPEVIAAYQRADLVLLNGAGYARWVPKSSLAASRLVNTTAGLEDRYIVSEEAVVHAHGPEGEHEHADVAFTTWLDPTLAIEQARAIRDRLAAARPAKADAFSARFDSLEADLLALDARLSAWAAGRAGRPLLGSHPVYQYLAARYGLALRSVHFEPGEMPSAAGWDDARRLVDERPADLMLWEGEPLPEVRERLATELGLRSVVFDPCGNRPATGDYLSVMQSNVDALEAAGR